MAFEMACMKSLETDSPDDKKSLEMEEKLKMHDPHYVKLIKKFPQLLNPNFVKGEPAHGVYHRIDIAPDATPCRAKRRPIIQDTIKAEAGKKAWEKMI